MTQTLRQPTAIRKTQIVEEVANLVMTKGMAGVTIHDIAAGIGVTEAAVYRHFLNKRQIFSYVIGKWEERLINSLSSPHLAETKATDDLERVFWSQIDSAGGHRALAFILIVEAITFEMPGLNAEVGEVMTNYMESIQQIIQKGIFEEEFRPDLNLDAAATAFMGLVQITATLWALNHYSSGLTEAAAAMFEIFKRGIYRTERLEPISADRITLAA